jgi:hypothetical protein
MLLPAAGRGMGIRWVGAKGTGKSRGLGRRLVLGDFDNRVPLVILDPVGKTIDNFLDCLVRRPGDRQRADGARLRYLDMGGTTGFVAPWPIYHRRPTDSLFAAADRPIEVWRRSDPALSGAPVQGLNAIANTGHMVGMILAGMGWRVTEAETLLRDPRAFEGHLLALGGQSAELYRKLKEPIEWLLSLPKPTTSEWRNQTNSYLNKVRALTLDDTARALYGAAERCVDWQEVVEDRLCLLVDFRGIRNLDHRRFGLLWVFHDLIDFIRTREQTAPPVSLVIDELTYFLPKGQQQQEVLAADFAELAAVLSRNRGVWLTVTHQELNQLSRDMANALMGMGTQIFGSTSDLETGAEVWAKRFDPYEPELVKKASLVGKGIYRTTEFSINEQLRLAAQQKYQDLPTFNFWAAVSRREGELGRNPQRFTIPTGDWVQEEKVARARQLLAERHGRKIEDVLAEIDGRIPHLGGDRSAPPTPPPKRRRKVDITVDDPLG